MFFLPNKTNRSIQRSKVPIYHRESLESLNSRIRILDKQISETGLNILQAHIVRIRTIFSSSKTIFGGLQQKFVETSTQQSILWHQNRLSELTLERTILQEKIDRINGKYWTKRFQKGASRVAILLCLIPLTFLLVIGFFTAIYVFPIFLLLGILIFIMKKLSLKNLS